MMYDLVTILADATSKPAATPAEPWGVQHWAVVIVCVGVGGLGAVFFGVRYWLAVTRPANVRDVPTPTIDRLNAHALDQLAAAHEGDAPAEVAADEEAPADLLAVVPAEEAKPGDASKREMKA